MQEKPSQTIVGDTPLGITMQTQLLSQYCSDKSNPSCSYVVTSPPLAEYGPATQVGKQVENCNPTPVKRSFVFEETKTAEDSIGLTLTAGASFDAHIFKVSTSVSTHTRTRCQRHRSLPKQSTTSSWILARLASGFSGSNSTTLLVIFILPLRP